jgi:GTP-binding protein
MHISSAIFDRSAPDLESCPDESLPEFAFIGRSNVGKSSLLNMLAGKDGLARVSPTPGHTKLINMFVMNKNWRLVDLPGYGYAQVARENRSQFNAAVNNYLEHRPNLCLIFALIDSNLPPQKIDVDFVQWLTSKSLPFVLVFTKTDKIPAAALKTNMDAFKARISAWFEQLPAIFTCSSTTEAGREQLLTVIDETIKAVHAESSQVSDSTEDSPAPQKKATASSGSKNRPDRQRPW